MVNKAGGEAESILRLADATAEGIRTVAKSVGAKGAEGAIKLKIAEQYITAFEKLAKETNTIVLPQNLSDTNSMVAQAMAIYNSLGKGGSGTPSLLETGETSVASLEGDDEMDGEEGGPEAEGPDDGDKPKGPRPPFSLQS